MLSKNGTVNSIKDWLERLVFPRRGFWLNFYKLRVCGMEGRTTSIGESMHHSMKPGADAAKPSHDVTTAANTMIDAAERKGKKRDDENAQQVARTLVGTDYVDSPTKDHLTLVAEKMAVRLWNATQTCRVLQWSPLKYLVFQPDKKVRKKITQS
jgi:hypothetical protein